MTMHLEHGLTTLNTSRRKKKKFTKKELTKFEKLRKENNKFFTKLGMTEHVMTSEQWMKYVSGKRRPKLKTRSYNDPFGRDTSLTKINDYLIASSVAQKTKPFLSTHYLQATPCTH